MSHVHDVLCIMYHISEVSRAIEPEELCSHRMQDGPQPPVTITFGSGI
jgi:hypothetical protein